MGKGLLYIGSVLLMCLSLGSCIFNSEARKPNILIFFVDDLGYYNVGFRNDCFVTPNIDKLSKESLIFNNAYIASPTCSPSRATLLTGKHPLKLKMVRHIPSLPKYGFDQFGRTSEAYHIFDTDPAEMPSRNWLPLEEISYAEQLKDAGYHTAFVGKWHLGHEPYHPIHQGFETQYLVSNFGHPANYYPPYFEKKGEHPLDGRYLTDSLTDCAVDYLKEYNSDKPFLLHISYYSVHTPHQGRTDLLKDYESKGVRGNYAHFGAMVTAVDESIGRVLEMLKKKKLEENTMVIFLSDQGSYFSNEPLRGGKTGGNALYEGGAKVPFFIKWPGVVLEGSSCNENVQSTDVFPTLLDIACVNSYKKIDGKSLLPLLKNPDASLGRDAIYFYRSYEDRYASVIQGEWKIILYRSGACELYNLHDDPYETNDISKDRVQKVQELKSGFHCWEKEMKE